MRVQNETQNLSPIQIFDDHWRPIVLPSSPRPPPHELPQPGRSAEVIRPASSNGSAQEWSG